VLQPQTYMVLYCIESKVCAAKQDVCLLSCRCTSMYLSDCWRQVPHMQVHERSTTECTTAFTIKARCLTSPLYSTCCVRSCTKMSSGTPAQQHCNRRSRGCWHRQCTTPSRKCCHSMCLLGARMHTALHGVEVTCHVSRQGYAAKSTAVLHVQ
jgi:hypothetical protein